MKKILIFGLLLLTTSLINIQAATRTSVTSGDFNDPATWGGIVPSAGDDIVIDKDDLVTVTTSPGVTFNSLTLKQNGDITINSDVVFSVSGAMDFQSKEITVKIYGTLEVYSITVASNNNTIDVYAGGLLDVGAGGVTLTGAGVDDRAGLVIENEGMVTVDGDFSANGNSDVEVNGSLAVEGTLDMDGTLVGTGQVYAGDFTGDGTIFGSDPDLLLSETTYEEGTGEAVPLPIVLTYFDVHNANDNVIITWQTASEENNHYFTIERSADGYNFENIGTVAGAGNSQMALNYSFIDSSPLNGTTYYRLQQTDYDGLYEVFDMVSVSYYNEQAWQLSPNPATTEITIDFGGLTAQSTIQILSLTGQVVKTFTVWESRQTLDISEIASGTYILSVANGNQPLIKRIVIH